MAGTDDDVLVLAFCSRSAKARVAQEGDRFRLRAGNREFSFDVVSAGRCHPAPHVTVVPLMRQTQHFRIARPKFERQWNKLNAC